MNIGIFTDTYLPQINGVVSSIVTLERQLRKQGHQVYIFTVSHPKAPANEEDVYRIPSMPFVFLKDYRVGLMYSSRLMYRIKRLKLDIILSQTEFSLGMFARLTGMRLHIPVVHTYHTMYEEYMHYISKGVEFSPELARKYSKKFCNHVDGVIAPTQKTKQLLLGYGVQTPIEVIPSGIDFSPFDKINYDKEVIDNLKNSLGLNTTDPIILFVGRVAKEKSIDEILYALPRVIQHLPTTKLVIIGDGPEMATLKTLAMHLGIEKNISFLGMKPWQEIGKYYQLGDIFVSASTSETQGLTFAEAMAASLPVIAKVDDSTKDLIIQGYNGCFFDSKASLETALITCLEDTNYRNTLAEHAKDSIAPLSDELFGQNAVAYYQYILSISSKLKNRKKDKKVRPSA